MGNKSVNNLYKPMLEHSNVEQKFHKAAKGKTERPDVAVILEPTNIQRHVKNVVEQLENTAPEGKSTSRGGFSETKRTANMFSRWIFDTFSRVLTMMS